MKLEKLNDTIPYVVGGKGKVLTMQPYEHITLAMPGRHCNQTSPVGGDFVVMVDDDNMNWSKHQFTHIDLFLDLEKKREHDAIATSILFNGYYAVILGGDPEKIYLNPHGMPGIHPQTFLYAVQCLAVAEHRRYAQFESKWGGRYLPFRFGAGIVEGRWSAAQAAEKTRRGRPGVEWLEKDHGVPELTKALMK